MLYVVYLLNIYKKFLKYQHQCFVAFILLLFHLKAFQVHN